jgi:hypothetical protein
MVKYIDFTYFLVSFSLGLCLVYILGTDIKVITVYPNPTNVKDILYKDSAGECFRMDYKEVKCSKHASNITSTPFQ